MTPNKEYTDIPAPLQRIRRRKEQLGISHQDLADMLHISQSTVARLMSGDTTLTFDTAVSIAEVLNMSLDEIAGHKPQTDMRSIDAIVSSYDERITSLRAAHTNLTSELKAAHEKEIDRMRIHYDARIADLMNDKKNPALGILRLAVRVPGNYRCRLADQQSWLGAVRAYLRLRGRAQLYIPDVGGVL